MSRVGEVEWVLCIWYVDFTVNSRNYIIRFVVHIRIWNEKKCESWKRHDELTLKHSHLSLVDQKPHYKVVDVGSC